MICGYRAGIAEIAHLNRRRAEPENPGAAVTRESHQIDGDIHFACAQKGRDLEIVFAAHVDELVERTRDARSQTALVVRSERNADGVESFLVVPLEDARQELSDGVDAKVARQICEANVVVTVTLPASKRGR